MSTQISNGAEGVRFVGLQRAHYSSRCVGHCNSEGARCRTPLDVPPAPPPADPYGIEERKRRRGK
jgi:hypothetical protein